MTTKTESPRLVKHLEVRRIADTGGWEILVDDEPLPWHVSRDPIEHVPSDGWGLHVVYLPLLVLDRVSGFDEYREFLDEESDQVRVRMADLRDSNFRHISDYDRGRIDAIHSVLEARPL